MVNYRRSLVAGGSYFFTLNLAERRLRLLTDHIDLLRVAFRYGRARHPFTVEAIVVLLDHLHAIFSLPEEDADYALRLRLIKTRFSRHLPRGERRSASRMARAELGIGQRRYWEHTLRDGIEPRSPPLGFGAVADEIGNDGGIGKGGDITEIIDLVRRDLA